MVLGDEDLTREKALRIIKKEQLDHFNWYDEHCIGPNEVVIQKNVNKWVVFTTDERECAVSEKFYHTESKALKDFIERVRAGKSLREDYDFGG